jgi:tyrosine-protein kinase Etk/Wzc
MLLITSSAPKEGKTVTALNLAGSFAQTGKRTLLVDCDIRRPRLHSVFAIDRIPGLTDYLIGKTNFDRILRYLFIKNLYLIPAGTIVPNPSELLGSNKMQDFLIYLRKEFDIVILDSAPIIPVTDSDILSRLVDATILVASANKTEIEVVQKSVEVLKQGRNSFFGVLLNNFNFKNAYSSYYKYNQYYSEESEKGKNKSKKFKV